MGRQIMPRWRDRWQEKETKRDRETVRERERERGWVRERSKRSIHNSAIHQGCVRLILSTSAT